jgi:hypothetical protein
MSKFLTSYRHIEQLRACRPIPEAQVREVCYKARELLIEEGNVVGVDAPVTVGLLLRRETAVWLIRNDTDLR